MSAVAVAVFLVLWQIIGMATSPILLATPIAVVQAVPAVVQRGLATAYAETMSIFLIGLVVSLVTAFVVGLVTGLNRYVRYSVDPIVTTLYSTPGIAVIPLLITWFGIGNGVKFTLVFLSVFFPIVANVQLGISEVSAHFIELGRSLGATRWEMIRKIVIPGIVPHVLAGLRIAAPRGFVSVLAAEMLVDQRSLGGLVVFYGNAFQTARYFVPVLVIMLTSVLLAEGVMRIEHAMTRWRRI